MERSLSAASHIACLSERGRVEFLGRASCLDSKHFFQNFSQVDGPGIANRILKKRAARPEPPSMRKCPSRGFEAAGTQGKTMSEAAAFRRSSYKPEYLTRLSSRILQRREPPLPTKVGCRTASIHRYCRPERRVSRGVGCSAVRNFIGREPVSAFEASFLQGADMHAFIIEDDYLIAKDLQDMLDDLGFTKFSFARSEDAAILAANNQHFDLITADVRLLPGDGVNAVEAISGKRNVPILFITAYREELEERKPGAAVLQKPVKKEELASAVRSILNGSAKTTQASV